MISNNNKGNPNHDSEGKFTSSGNTASAPMPPVPPEKGNKYHDETSGKFSPKENNIENKLSKYGFSDNKTVYKPKEAKMTFKFSDGWNEDYVKFDADTDDLIDYFKSLKIDLTDDDIEQLYDWKIPERLEDEYDDDYFEDFIREKYEDEIHDLLEDQKEWEKGPESYYGVSRRM